jgi:lysozyme
MFDRRPLLPALVALLLAIVAMPSLATPVAAAGTDYLTNCGVNLRAGPSLTAAVRVTLPKGTTVTSTGTVSGSAYAATCGGAVRGRTWIRIVAIDGQSVASRYGVTALYAARWLFRDAPPPTTGFLANCRLNLRSSPSTNAWLRRAVPRNSVVTVRATVSGGRWQANCGSSVRGSSWLKIVAINGRSVSSLFGVDAVYAAKGLFRSLSSTTYLEGIDVSNWQGVIDWLQVRAAGKRFVIAKASEGVGYQDRSYDRNKAGAMAQGLAFGAYHFARPENDPVAEADWFIEVAGYRRGMIIPALDLERTGGRSPASLTSWTKAWLQRVYERLGVRAMIYTSPSFWRQNLDNTAWFANHGYAILWAAHWERPGPSVAASNWAGRSWTFWQYSNTGTVPGIDGYVDLNRFHFASLRSVTY